MPEQTEEVYGGGRWLNSMLDNDGKDNDSGKPVEPASQKQIDLIRRLADLKIKDESTKNHYVGNLVNTNKLKASHLIGELLRM